MNATKKILYAHCIFVSGYLRDCLYDLHFGQKHFFPSGTGIRIHNGDFDLKLTDNDDVSILQYLEKNDLIFYVNEKHLDYYPKMNLQWDFYSDITSCEIETSKFTNKKIELIKKIVDTVKCYHLKLRCNYEIDELTEVIKKYEFDEIKSIDIYLNNRLHEQDVIKMKDKNLVIENVYHSKSFLGNINKYMMINTSLFTESQAHHTYFNRKLYIGPNGEIKNAPECEETFGNISDLKDVSEIKQIVQSEDFQKYWYVHKEICDVCKDCEFRHICVDNRLPYQRSQNEWYHKTECNYNPYICKWQGEEGYLTLEECGVISNEHSFSIDHEKIAKINKQLWGE